jgi:hypothetical protein
MAQFPSSIPFVSFLRYSPKVTSELSIRSRQICYAIKGDGLIDVPSAHGDTREQVRAIDRAALRVAFLRSQFPVLEKAFGQEVTRVPVPRSAPIKPGTLWPAERLCYALQAQSLASDVLTCLERVKAVPKSATAGPGERASPEDHFQSLKITLQASLVPPKRITIVDDVITRGSTFLGSWPHFAAAFPNTPLICFGLIRTESYRDIESLIEPIEGTVSFRHGQPHRDP